MLLLFIRIVKQALTECQQKIFIDYLRMVIKKGFVLFIQTAPLLDFTSHSLGGFSTFINFKVIKRNNKVFFSWVWKQKKGLKIGNKTFPGSKILFSLIFKHQEVGWILNRHKLLARKSL